MPFQRYLTNRAFVFTVSGVFIFFSLFVLYAFNSAYSTSPINEPQSASEGLSNLKTPDQVTLDTSELVNNKSNSETIASSDHKATDDGIFFDKKKPLQLGFDKETKKDKTVPDSLKIKEKEDLKKNMTVPDPSPVVTSDDSLDQYSYCQANTPNPSEYSEIKNSTLLSVHLMTRHGDRTPTVFLPFGLEKDPWICNPESTLILDSNSSYPVFTQRTTMYNQDACISKGYCSVNPFQPVFWPGNCTRGQLTPKGSHQLYTLGTFLKDIYIDKLGFLSKEWSHSQEDIFVRSTDFWRTQQSATSLISGMFHSSISKLSNLFIYTMPSEIETLASNRKGCPKLVTLETNMKSSPTYKNYLASVEHDRTKFEKILGEPRIGDSPEYIDYYVDSFQARTCHGFPDVCRATDPKNKNTTKCVTRPMIDQMMIYGNAENRITFRDHPIVFPILARLRIGGFLLEIKRNILLAIASHSGEKVINTQHPKAESDPNFAFPPVFSDDQFRKKFFYYSAHDTSLGALRGALHSQDMKWSPYASNFLFELWASNSNDTKILENYQMRMIYNGANVRTPWCVSGVCPVSAFLNYLDTSLGIVGGFENYGIFLTPEKSPSIWNYLNECWVN